MYALVRAALFVTVKNQKQSNSSLASVNLKKPVQPCQGTLLSSNKEPKD
jgi:hypothetical protein